MAKGPGDIDHPFLVSFLLGLLLVGDFLGVLGQLSWFFSRLGRTGALYPQLPTSQKLHPFCWPGVTRAP